MAVGSSEAVGSDRRLRSGWGVSSYHGIATFIEQYLPM